jgi:DNA invertase Pin-like site-specific DNA recombinase
MAVYGYARVSTVEQNLERQIQALKEAKCQEIFMDKFSGATLERPQLQKLFKTLKEGDTIIIVDLTRFSRSTMDLFALIEDLKQKGCFLKSIKDTWLDLSKENPFSTLLLTIFAGISQFERDMIRQRQSEGIAIAKQKGIYKGRPTQFTEKNPKLSHALELYKGGGYTVKEVCMVTGVSEATFYRNWRKLQEKEVKEKYEQIDLKAFILESYSIGKSLDDIKGLIVEFTENNTQKRNEAFDIFNELLHATIKEKAKEFKL